MIKKIEMTKRAVMALMVPLMLIYLSAVSSATQASGGAAVPAPGVHDTTPATSSYHIPFKLSPTHHLMIRARINGVGPFTFIMDTGAPAVYLSKTAATRCHVTPTADGWGTLEHIDIEGGAPLEKLKARIEEPPQLQGMNSLGLAAMHIDGVFGYNLLARFRIQIDLTQTKMTWTSLDYIPELPTGLAELSEEEKQALKKSSKNVQQMEGMEKMASSLFSRPMPTSVPRGFLGIEFADTAHDLHIVRLLQGSPAAKSGLMVGDVVERIAGPRDELQPVHVYDDILRFTDDLAPGEAVRFMVKRGNRKLTLTVQSNKNGF